MKDLEFDGWRITVALDGTVGFSNAPQIAEWKRRHRVGAVAGDYPEPVRVTIPLHVVVQAVAQAVYASSIE